MTIEIKRENYYLAVGYVYPPTTEHLKANPQLERKSDWLGVAWIEEGHIVLRYRFRYYNSDEKMDGDDKNWYTVRGKFTEETREVECKNMVNAMNILCGVTAMRNGSRFEVLPIDGNGDKALEVIANAPFSIMQTVPHNQLEVFENFESN